MPPAPLRGVLALHRLGLRLYPRVFRAEFEAEMQAVFAEALAEAARGGAVPVARLLAREAGTAPGQIIEAHWRAARPEQTAGGAVQAEAGMATRLVTRGVAATLLALLLVAPFVIWFWWMFGREANLGLLLPAGAGLAVLAGAWAWALSPATRRLRAGVWLPTGLLCLVGLFWPTAQLVEHQLEIWPDAVQVVIFCLPAVALVVSALLVAASLNAWPAPGAPLPWTVPAGLALAALLTAKVFANLYWLLVWDLTYDPLSILWLVPEGLAAVLGGGLLALDLRGGRRWAGAYGALVLAGLAALAAHMQIVDYRALTTARGEQVARTIEAFHTRTGRYPATLDELGLWSRLTRPTPIIINGQDWCYQGSGAAYQLGYVDRAHWSSPELFARLGWQAGTLAGAPPLCADEIAALGQPRAEVFDFGGWPWAGAGLLARIQPGQTRAETLERALDVWHRDSCVPARAPGADYAYLDLLWTGANNVRQATVVAVHYAWETGRKLWVVERAEQVPRAELYALYGGCSSLDLAPLAPAP